MRIFFRRSSLARQIGLYGFSVDSSISATRYSRIENFRSIPRPCLGCPIRRLLLFFPAPSNRFFHSTNNRYTLREKHSTNSPDSVSQVAQASPQHASSLAPNEIKNLPSEAERRRSDFSKRFSTTMDNFQSAVFTVGQRLNDLTGYSGIEALKKSIEDQEAHVNACRQEVKSAKGAYQAAINRRSASQREVNELLQRKHAWNPSDLERFTELYRSDHANEQAEAAAQERLSRAEQLAEEAQSQLARSILTRYHEEQIWSDKIRRSSTWGTWGLMGFNVLLFIVVQLGLEPWKRRRLVGGFEEKVREVIQEENIRNALSRLEHQPATTMSTIAEPEDILPLVAEVKEPMETVEMKIIEVTSEVPPEASVAEEVQIDEGEIFAEAEQGSPAAIQLEQIAGKSSPQNQPHQLKARLAQFWSDDTITLRRRDVAAIALESAAAGAIITAAGIMAFLINHSR